MTALSESVARAMRLPAPQTREIGVRHDLRVPMDDGTVLLADRYAPAGAAPGPTVLVRTPYGRRGPWGLLYGRLLAERGLPAVVQSVRGTFGSGGDFNPFDERADGLATLRWVRSQPWHRGGIGMAGPSYLGLTQWAVARPEDGVGPDALAPSVTASQFHAQAAGTGAISLETALTWMVIVGLQEQRLAPLRVAHRLRRLAGVADQWPLGELDTAALGRRVPFYAEWMRHTAADDPYWVARDFSAGIEEVVAPVQLVAGWQDIFLPWQLEDFSALQDAGRSPQLIVGPWTHAAPGLASKSLREAIAWLRAHLLGDRRLLDPAPVRLWMGGVGGWRRFGTWPPEGIRPWRLHAQPGRGLAEQPPPGAAAPARYRYDPRDPTPAVGGPGLLTVNPVVDNAPLEARPDVLTFTLAGPLSEPVDAIGPVSVRIHARASIEHFDLFARLCDVDPAGVSRNVCDALVRVLPGRYEADPDGVLEVGFALWPTAHRFERGHRIRLQVSSGAHPRYARNAGTGEDPATAARLVPADVEVFAQAVRPTALTLSVLPRRGG